MGMAGGAGFWDEKALPTSYVLAWKTVADSAGNAGHPLGSRRERERGPCFSLCSKVSEYDINPGYDVIVK